MIASGEIPHIANGLKQSPEETRLSVAADMMARAAKTLRLSFNDPEEAISRSVGIITDTGANRRQKAAAQVLALCAKAVDAGNFPPSAIDALQHLLGNAIGFDDEAQQARAMLSRKSRAPKLKEAYNVVLAENPTLTWKGIAKVLTLGVRLQGGQFVKIEYDPDNRIIPIVDGKTFKSISEKTFMQYGERKTEPAYDGLVDG